MIYLIDPSVASVIHCPTFCKIKPCYGVPI